MVTLYVCSPETGAGKTALCVAIAQRLARDGLAVGYQKPVGLAVPTPDGEIADPDALFARQVLRLRLPLATLSPVALTEQPSRPDGAPERLRDAFETASRDRDAMVLEGAPSLTAGSELGLGAPEVLRLLGGRALLVVPYAREGLVEAVLGARDALGGNVLGAVVTAVPEVGQRDVERAMKPALAAAGVELLGALPLRQELLGTTVGELAAALGGEFLCGETESDRPVEAYMVAAMSDLGADEYFRRQARKAVIASGDKPDVHMPALQTDTSCLVLTNGLDPDPTVLALARDLDVPLVKVAMDTFAAMEAISELLPKVRFRQRAKVPIMSRLLEEHLDYAALRRGLGLPGEVAS